MTANKQLVITYIRQLLEVYIIMVVILRKVIPVVRVKLIYVKSSQ